MNLIQKILAFLHIGGTAAQTATSTPEINTQVQTFENDLNTWINQGEGILTAAAALGSVIPQAAAPLAVLTGYITVGVQGLKTAESVFDAALAAAEKAGGFTGTTPTPPA